jgi:hypothetical protein
VADEEEEEEENEGGGGVLNYRARCRPTLIGY